MSALSLRHISNAVVPAGLLFISVIKEVNFLLLFALCSSINFFVTKVCKRFHSFSMPSLLPSSSYPSILLPLANQVHMLLANSSCLIAITND